MNEFNKRTRPKGMWKFVCPNCGQIVWGWPYLEALCEPCGQLLLAISSDESEDVL
jgi:hypothetical protein